MPLNHKSPVATESLATISHVALISFIIAMLYFGRDLLVVLSMAALLTFMLAPLATWMQRWIGRVAAALVVASLLIGATIGAGWILTRQAVDVANSLPAYKENIQSKLRSLKMPRSSKMNELSETLEELKKDLPTDSVPLLESGEEKRDKATAAPVKIVSTDTNPLHFLTNLLSPILGPLGTASLVLLLVIFMLLQREDLQNRFIRLVGQGRIGATTRAMNDAGSRVSRYLRMQLVVNVTYGIPVAIGLYFIGIPSAILWGALATILRFVPYVGPWIAAAFPILLSLAVAPSWQAPALTIALFIVLELISNNVMEPWLYGSSTGVSPIALIVAALFWTFLWGPLGLVLATPLTVCLVVMGRHIPRMAFLSVLLSDEEALTPAEECYHRLHRVSLHGDAEWIDVYLRNNSLEMLFDAVLIPVLTTAESDYRAGALDTQQLENIHQGMREILTELEARSETAALARPETIGSSFQFCCIPARASRDELVGEMVVRLMRSQGYDCTNASAKMVSGELIAWVGETQPEAVCISAVPPTSMVHARYLCSSLRARYPNLTILVGMWGQDLQASGGVQILTDAGANEVIGSVSDIGNILRRVTDTEAGNKVNELNADQAPTVMETGAAVRV